MEPKVVCSKDELRVYARLTYLRKALQAVERVNTRASSYNDYGVLSYEFSEILDSELARLGDTLRAFEKQFENTENQENDV